MKTIFSVLQQQNTETNNRNDQALVNVVPHRDQESKYAEYCYRARKANMLKR